MAVAFFPVATFAQTPSPFTKPALEIPIPFVNFTDAVRNNGDITIPWLSQYVSGVYQFLISIVGVVAALMIMIGGYQYVTAGGDKNRVQKGKERILNALIGLVLAFGSYLILYVINPDLVSFKALGLMSVETELYTQGLDGADLEAQPTDPTTPPTPTIVSGSGRTVVCNSVQTCLPFCKIANCTKVWSYKAEVSAGKYPNYITDTSKNDCNRNKFPNLSTQDILPPNSSKLIRSDKWPAMKNIKASGAYATQLVVDGLKRASDYIDQKYPDQGLAISVSTCWRDYRLDFGKECSVILRVPPYSGHIDNNPVRAGMTWPGANPHSAGQACDIRLLKNGRAISGVGYNQTCKSVKEGNRLLAEIMTNPTVGARRLKYEVWHFNFAGWNNCYCSGSGCDNFLSPRIPNCSSGNFTKNSC